jgi:putative membrane protein insertion efficiency factor
MQRFLIALVRFYRVLLSPYLGRHCRFTPSCSAYAIEALHKHGALRGVGMSVRRLVRCHPWCAGGFDPVPD